MSIWICIAFLAYYSVFQIFSDFVRSGQCCNTPNKTIAYLRTRYKVNVRTFQKNNSLTGFAWFKSVWLNENLFKNKSRLLFAFHHEHFHLKHNHKFWVLFMRFVLSLLPLLLSLVYWWVFVIVFLASAMLIQYISDKFEDKANGYAYKMIANEDVPDQKKKSSR